jgi:RNA polymerase sigma-70 factor (ECF subfamily)
MERADRVSSALEAVISRFRTMVRSVGARRGLSEVDIDDVLQEVRIRLWHACNERAAGGDEWIEQLGASYVYRTAMSAAVDILRRQRARAVELTDSLDDQPADLPATSRGPLAELEATELGARISAAVDELPLARRAVVRMYLTGYERDEIAELLGWTEGKTRNLLYRGLDDLRRRLTELGITRDTL